MPLNLYMKGTFVHLSYNAIVKDVHAKIFAMLI